MLSGSNLKWISNDERLIIPWGCLDRYGWKILVLSFNKEVFVTVLHGDQRLETMRMEHALLCHTQHVFIC